MSIQAPVAVQRELSLSSGRKATASGIPTAYPILPAAPSFELLFHTYYARLCAFATRYVGCPDTAEEVVGEVFLRIWIQRRHDEDRRRCSKRFLYTAVRNQALKVLDHERVVRRSREIVLHQEHLPGMSQPPIAADEALQADELAAAVRRAVDQLPERCRQAYLLRRQQGMSYVQIAEAMGTSVRTVETQLARAARTLRGALAAWLP